MLWLYIHGFMPLLFTVALCAGRWGQGTERAAAALFVLALAGSKLAKWTASTGFFYVETELLAIDAALLGALAWLAVRSGRGWLIWATAFQLLSTSAHLARAMDSGLSALAYQIMEEASSYPTVIALAIGIARNPRPRARPVAKS